MATIDPGLEHVVVAATRCSEVDGTRGRLIVAGHPIERLAEQASVERLAAMLWSCPEPAVRDRLGRGRERAFERIDLDAIDRPDGMDALRAGLARLGPQDDPVAAAAVIFAAWTRHRRGLEAIPPSCERSHAEDLLCMVLGSVDPALADALRTYLVTVADHGLNASTFTARVVTSTGSDTISAMVAAVGALKGPLHGGAPGPVLDMLDAVEAGGDPESWLRSELEAGRRIMGMGHRVYRVRDPRAAVLERAARRLAEAGVGTARLALAQQVEQIAGRVLSERHPDRALRANVEFYTAVLLDALGWHRTWFTPTFAVARAVGWQAHILEQRAVGRIVRPRARYVGARPQG